jgi:DNA-binding response OmpR family regulator
MVLTSLPHSNSPRPAGKQLIALVVEDDQNTRRMIGVILKQEGFDVHEATDGVDAIEQVRAGGYALVVLDMMMPHIDGVGVMEYIRRHRPASLRNVIVTSALPPADMKRLCDPDICSLLAKPFDIEELRRMARECASSSD